MPEQRALTARAGALSFPRCTAARDIRSAFVGLVDDLRERWELPSAYLLVDGRLRCQASRGYFQVSDGFTASTGVIGRVVSSGIGEVVEDVTADPAFVAAAPDLRAEICLPVVVFGQVVGAVNLESRDALGADALADVERAAVVLNRRLEALGGLPDPSSAERLARMAVELAGAGTEDEVRWRSLRSAVEISGMSTAALAHPRAEDWAITDVLGPLGPVLETWDSRVLEMLSRWVQAKTSSYFPPGERLPDDYGFLAESVRALSLHPLVAAGRVTGLLMTADVQPAGQDPALTAAMELLATQTGAMLALTQTLEELSYQASHDPLTGLRNRPALLEQLGRAAATGGSALLLLDLDGFKALNDQRGHAEGDAVLTRVAQALLGAADDHDVVFRLGGDEFAVLMTRVPDARAAAERGARFVDAAVQAQSDQSGPSVGASAGVRLLDRTAADTALADADRALYAAKRAGGGVTVVSPAGARPADDRTRTAPR